MNNQYKNRIDFYLINDTGIVEYTTYNNERFLDFKEWPVFYEDLQKIRLNNSFVPDEIVNGFSTGTPLKKFVYQPTPDHRFVAEVSLNVQNDSVSQRTTLSYKNLITYILNNNKNLQKLHVFDSLGNIDQGKRDYPAGPDNVTKKSVQTVLEEKNRIITRDPKNHSISTYIYVPHDVDETPSSKYQNLVGKFTYSTENLERELTYTRILHILLAFFASLVAILTAWILSQSLATPINHMIEEIDDIASGNLDRRISQSRHPELDRISNAFRGMMTQIRQNISDLETSERRYRSLFEYSNDAILILRNNLVIDINPVTEKFSKMNWNYMVGKDISELCPTVDSIIEKGLFPTDKDVTVLNPKGETRAYNIRVQQISLSGEDIIQVQVRDITERHQLEETMKTMNIALEDEVKRRTRQQEEMISELDSFTYTVSHDLKGPLRIIDGFAHILEDIEKEKNYSEIGRYIVKIRENIQKMEDLIDDLLRLSRANRQTLNITNIDTDLMVQSVIKECVSQFLNHEILIDIGPLPDIKGDSGLIRQVFMNLITNAVKYRKKGCINHIKISSYTENNQTVYTVQDTGIGFDMQYSNKIFDPFVQLHYEGEYEGTGTGLAIVKRIVSRHGGEIWVLSEPGVGTKFSFTIPFV